MSSSWKEDASQTTVAPAGRPLSASVDAAVPTFPATATGAPASRWMWPISSVVVVLPLVPVTAMNSLGISRQAISSSPITGNPRWRAAAMTGASWGTPGLLMSVRARAASSVPDVWRCTSTPASESPSAAGEPASQPITSSPRACSARATATPERSRPTTRKGPSGSGGRGFMRVNVDVRPVGAARVRESGHEARHRLHHHRPPPGGRLRVPRRPRQPRVLHRPLPRRLDPVRPVARRRRRAARPRGHARTAPRRVVRPDGDRGRPARAGSPS